MPIVLNITMMTLAFWSVIMMTVVRLSVVAPSEKGLKNWHLKIKYPLKQVEPYRGMKSKTFSASWLVKLECFQSYCRVNSDQGTPTKWEGSVQLTSLLWKKGK